MNKIKAITFSIIILVCFIVVAAMPAFAQMGVPITPPANNNAPIGGLAVLAALGGGYAIKKLYDSRQ